MRPLVVARHRSLLIASWLAGACWLGCGEAPITPVDASVVSPDAAMPALPGLPAGADCSADAACLSRRCHASARVCVSTEGEACRIDVGCVSGDERVVCATDSASVDTGTCTANAGTAYASCTRDEDCVDATCSIAAGRCGNGRAGEPCDDALDCVEGLCLEGACQEGAHASLCLEDADCDSASCRAGTCVDGRDGDACRDDADCPSSYCNLVALRCAEPCEVPAACGAARVCTREGLCSLRGERSAGAECTDDAACASGSCFPYGGLAAPRACAPAGGDDTRCELATDCAAGYECVDMHCALPNGAPCGHRFSDGRRVLSACVTGTSCSPRDGGLRCFGTDAVCFEDADCPDGACVLRYACT